MAFYGENSSGRFCPRRVHCSEFAVSEFIDKHLIENQPVIIMGCTQDWQTRKQWIKEDGTPNFEFLLDQFGLFFGLSFYSFLNFLGDLRVPITCCKSGKLQTIVFSEFIQQYFDNPQNDLYIRDWHFMKFVFGTVKSVYFENLVTPTFNGIKCQSISKVIGSTTMRSNIRIFLAEIIDFATWADLELGNSTFLMHV